MSPARPQAGNQAAQERLKAAAAGRDPQGKKGALPFRDKLKSSMGIDFAGAAAIFGAKDALAAEGAKAAQVGKTMLFAEERPSLETVAHEAAHFAQREKGGATRPGTDKGGGLAEEEAHDAADAVVKGETATLEAPAEAAVHRLADPNPEVSHPNTQEYVDPTNPTFVSDTTTAPAAPGAGAGTGGQVVIKSTEAAPVVSEATPPAAALYEEVAQGGTPYASQQYTVDSPLAMSGLHPDRLYIDGAPSVEDIIQGSLGDCYFLAALTSVVVNDPGHLMGILSMQGDLIQADLWEASGTDSDGQISWAPHTISMDRKLLVDTESASLVGAKLRTSGTMSERRWWAELDGDALMVRSYDLYEAALWAPLMEKAYAMYTEAINMQPDASSTQTGNETIGAGGFSRDALAVLYGPGLVESDMQSTKPVNEGGQLEPKHIQVLQGLASIENSPVSEDGSETRTLIEASTSGPALARRLPDDITRCKATPEYADAVVARMVDTLQSATSATSDLKVIGSAALKAAKSPLWPQLQKAGLAWQDLNETVDTLANEAKEYGNNTNTGSEAPLNLYTPHAYSVLRVEFFDGTCAPLQVTPDRVPDMLSTIDPFVSTVHIRNPHGTGEPNTHGTDGKDDGTFTMNLRQYLHSFSHQTVTQVTA